MAVQSIMGGEWVVTTHCFYSQPVRLVTGSKGQKVILARRQHHGYLQASVKFIDYSTRAL